MSTSNSSAPQGIAATLEHDLGAVVKSGFTLVFDGKHLVLTALLAIAIFAGVYIHESKVSALADAKANASLQMAQQLAKQAKSSEAQNQSFQTQMQQAISGLQAANVALTTQNAQLASDNKALVDKLTAQQKTDATLAPSDQAARWEMLVQGAKVNATETGFQINSAGGVSTIQALEEIPVDRQQIQNLESTINNDQTIILNGQTALADEKKAHQSDNTTNEEQLNADKAEIAGLNLEVKAEKAKGRKRFLQGVIVGTPIGIVLKAFFPSI